MAVLEITDSKLELGAVLAKLLQAEQRLGSRADNRALFTNKASKPQHRVALASGNAKECWYCATSRQNVHSWDAGAPGSWESGQQAMGATVVNLDWVRLRRGNKNLLSNIRAADHHTAVLCQRHHRRDSPSA